MNWLLEWWRRQHYKTGVGVMLDMSDAMSAVLMDCSKAVREHSQRDWTPDEVCELLEMIATEVTCTVRGYAELPAEPDPAAG